MRHAQLTRRVLSRWRRSPASPSTLQQLGRASGEVAARPTTATSPSTHTSSIRGGRARCAGKLHARGLRAETRPGDVRISDAGCVGCRGRADHVAQGRALGVGKARCSVRCRSTRAVCSRAGGGLSAGFGRRVTCMRLPGRIAVEDLRDCFALCDRDLKLVFAQRGRRLTRCCLTGARCRARASGLPATRHVGERGVAMPVLIVGTDPDRAGRPAVRGSRRRRAMIGSGRAVAPRTLCVIARARRASVRARR